jgi:hypothetical protein
MIMKAALVFLFLAGCGTLPAGQEPPAPDFDYTINAEGDGNTLVVSTEGQTFILDIHSQSGTGRASLERVSEAVPQEIVLRLHLDGLEEFRLSYQDTTLVASAPNSGSREILQSVVTSGEGERQITQEDPLWMEIEFVPGQAATPSATAGPGYFEVTLPEELRQSEQPFSIQWIDFFR